MNTSLITIESEPAKQQSLDYHRIEKAIAYLQVHYLEQPDLAAVARAAHLSEFHFQRLFTRWAGISPKRFLQFLTVEHAKQQLAESKPVLEATFDSGLSSPGRLHDLFVSVEAVTPGEFKSRGDGIRINFGLHATHFGDCLLGVTERGVCWLGFVCGNSSAEAIIEMKRHWAGATFARRPDLTESVARKIFSGLEDGKQSPFSLLLLGTNFQIKVWQALLKIPAGALISYERIGGFIGARQSSRAIGSAVGSNPIAYLIPCHRVIRKSGLLGGYRWGETRKQAMQGWEAARRFSSSHLLSR
ncbi:MAG: methylated-DNA--[protein]-cysteine S-methyltransferase [Verrucomicrobia bacterium]|nr:methylated-DNA--[protein]-cysteine S-methyltransferase [Verrucomicrobiota bacterium]